MTQQFTPIFQDLLRGASAGDAAAPLEERFRRDPLAAPLPTQLSTSPAETEPPSTLDAVLLADLPPVASSALNSLSGLSALSTSVEADRPRLRAVPVATGGAHRAEPHRPTRARARRSTAESGAHRAPETESRSADSERPAAGRGGRHRTLRAVNHQR